MISKVGTILQTKTQVPYKTNALGILLFGLVVEPYVHKRRRIHV